MDVEETSDDRGWKLSGDANANSQSKGKEKANIEDTIKLEEQRREESAVGLSARTMGMHYSI